MDVNTGSALPADPQQFKQQVYNQLKKAGVVSSLKSQLRAQLLQQLRKIAGSDALKAPAASDKDQTTNTMWHSAANSMVAEFLQAIGYQFTLSVFTTEAELAEQPAFSREDLFQLLRLDQQPQLQQQVQQLLESEGCFALALLRGLSACTRSAAFTSSNDAACQTSSSEHMEGLNMRLMHLDNQYIIKASQKQPRLALEEQMEQYRMECDALVESQVAVRVARLKGMELAAARQEMQAKYRQQYELERMELERVHADRLARLAAREEQVTEKLRRQQRDVEAIAYAQRQHILAEEERMRVMKAEVSRQLEVQEQLLRGLEAQIKERERVIAAREHAAESKLAEAAELESKLAAAARKNAQVELAEEMATMRGERVALEAERARITELRQAVNTDLAVARAKEDRLRCLESARAEAEARSAAHAAGEEVLRLQLSHLQKEVATLQQELVCMGAAAAQPGAGMVAAARYGIMDGVSGEQQSVMQLPQALQQLGHWQQRAQEAEHMLDEVTAARDAAELRAEELSLELSAARREVAALQATVAKQQDNLHFKLLSHSHTTAGAAGMVKSATTSPLRGSRVPAGSGQGVSVGAGFSGLNRPSSSYSWRSTSHQSPPRLQPLQQPPVVGALVVSRSPGGSDSQAALSRLAQLAAHEAAVKQQMEEYRRRAAAQRAAATRQLEDLRGLAAATAASCRPQQQQQQQQQRRLSIPSESDEEEAGIEDTAAQELLLQQQRRAALEVQLQPAQLSIGRLHTHTGTQYAVRQQAASTAGYCDLHKQQRLQQQHYADAGLQLQEQHGSTAPDGGLTMPFQQQQQQQQQQPRQQALELLSQQRQQQRLQLRQQQRRQQDDQQPVWLSAEQQECSPFSEMQHVMPAAVADNDLQAAVRHASPPSSAEMSFAADLHHTAAHSPVAGEATSSSNSSSRNSRYSQQQQRSLQQQQQQQQSQQHREPHEPQKAAAMAELAATLPTQHHSSGDYATSRAGSGDSGGSNAVSATAAALAIAESPAVPVHAVQLFLPTGQVRPERTGSSAASAAGAGKSIAAAFAAASNGDDTAEPVAQLGVTNADTAANSVDTSLLNDFSPREQPASQEAASEADSRASSSGDELDAELSAISSVIALQAAAAEAAAQAAQEADSAENLESTMDDISSADVVTGGNCNVLEVSVNNTAAAAPGILPVQQQQQQQRIHIFEGGATSSVDSPPAGAIAAARHWAGYGSNSAAGGDGDTLDLSDAESIADNQLETVTAGLGYGATVGLQQQGSVDCSSSEDSVF